ncbi:MAG: prepilin-type N-terminal cleavage/methylation domain-containing protein [Acetobacteraceae bacterium]
MSGGRWSGFTLLETLVALVVLGLLIGGLTGVVHFALRARGTEARLAAQGEGLDAVDRTLRGLLTQMDPGGFAAPPTLEGEAHEMHFLTELPAGAAVEGIRSAVVILAVDRKNRLVLAWRLAPHAVALRPPPQGRVILLHDVAEIAISYERPWTEGGGWVSEWRTAALPALVRIRIVFNRGDRRLWPDIVAAPMRERLR